MFNNKKIAIIGAMDCEIALIKEFLNDIEIIEDKFPVFLGKIKNNTIILAKSGVGKVAASSCTQYLIDKFTPDFIINTGVAGGIGKNLKIKDIVVGNSFIEYDFNATALGYAKGYVCNGINPNSPTIFYSDKDLTDKIYNAIKNIVPEENLHIGRIVSGDTFVADINKKMELEKEFKGLVSEMEGASIAHCATLNNIPFTSIRAVSDLADGTKIEDYVKFEADVAKLSAKILKNILIK